MTSAQASSLSPTLSLVCAERLFDGRGTTLRDAGVAIENEQIVAVDTRAQLIQRFGPDVPVQFFPDCTLLPGLIDVHTHLIMPGTGVDIMHWSQQPDDVLLMVALRNAWTALQAGITTVVDLGAKGDITFRLRRLL